MTETFTAGDRVAVTSAYPVKGAVGFEGTVTQVGNYVQVLLDVDPEFGPHVFEPEELRHVR